MKFCIIFVFLVCCLPLQARKIAVVIGVGAYPKDSGLSPLAADNDTRLLKAALEKAGWEEKNIYLLNCKTALEQPEMATILKAVGLAKDSLTGTYSLVPFTGVLSNLKSTDELLFFFGGHGVTNREGTDCLVPKEAKYNQDSVKFVNEFCLISLEWIQRSLCRSGAFVMIFIDACRNDIATGSSRNVVKGIGHTPIWGSRKAKVMDGPVVAKTDTYAMKERLVLVRSTGRNASAIEMQQTTNAGVFTYFLIRLLSTSEAQEEADNQPSDGRVTLEEGLAYLKEQTKSFVDNLVKKNSEQIPDIYLSLEVEKTRLFIEVETKRIGNPRDILQFNTLNRKLPLESFTKPVFSDPSTYVPVFFRVDPNGKILELANAQDKYPRTEFDFDERFLVSPGFVDPNEFFFGFRPFEFYFPTEILNKVRNRRQNLPIKSARFAAYKQALINGSCAYNLKDSTGEFQMTYNGREKKVKVWKITQRLKASNDDPCHPLNVQAVRTYFVLKSAANPVILEMESYFCFYIDKERVDPAMTNCRSILKNEVAYKHIRINQIFIQD